MNDIKNTLTIVVVSFNSGEVILSSLGELISSSICRVIIVDNASTDGSQSLLREALPTAEIIALSSNIGYGSAANVALKLIDTQYGLLLNPDVLLSLDKLIHVFDRAITYDNNVAVFSPALKFEDFHKKGDVSVDYLIGAFLVFNMAALKKVGWFDESIFLFYEEKDLELRLLNKGYTLLLQSDIFVEHLKSASTKSNEKIIFLRNWHVAWSKLFYMEKHGLLNRKWLAYYWLARYAAKSLFNQGDKKIKYKARFCGVKAYLANEKAFTKAGYGQYADTV